jgi:hypothetical protein
MVMALSLDRLGRSLQDKSTFLSERHALDIDLFYTNRDLTGGCRPAKPCSRWAYSLSLSAQCFRNALGPGLARAKSEDERLGRPPIPSDIEPPTKNHLLVDHECRLGRFKESSSA